ncbi:MAG: OmpH family outer membrane protein [Pseudomonadota bacterium]
MAATTHSRRSLLAGALAALLLPAAPLHAQGDYAVISRDRLLNELAAARALRAAETEITRSIQAAIDAAQAELTAEEVELAQARGELAPDVFELRTADFDRRLRYLRRTTQERVARINTGFQRARAQIIAALPQVLEQLRQEAGVRIIIDADAVFAADPSLDLTDRAIALYDAIGPRPAPPVVDLETPLLPPPAPMPTEQ